VDGYRISQLAERTGVPATTLRFYETAGLLSAERTAAGYRVYGEEAVERRSFIAAAKRLGLPLEEIAELLVVWENGACADVRDDLRPRLAARIGEAERHAAAVALFAATLHRALDHLDALPDRAERCGPHCLMTEEAEYQGSGTGAGMGAGVQVVVEERVGVEEPVGVEDRVKVEEEVGDGTEAWRRAPVACSLASLGDREARAAQWAAVLDGALRTRVADGLRLGLPVDRAAELAELVTAEQACCPFLGFRLEFDGPRLVLEVRAPAEGAEILAGLFG